MTTTRSSRRGRGFPELAADTELTFTLTVTGRGGTDGIAPGTDTATVMVNVTTDATLSDLSLEDGDGNAIALSQPFAPDTPFYTASVAYSIDAVTLTAVKNDSNATVVITNDDDTATLGEADAGSHRRVQHADGDGEVGGRHHHEALHV